MTFLSMSTCTVFPSDFLKHSRSLSSSSDSTFQTLGSQAGIVPTTTFCAFSEALTYFPPGPLNVCFFWWNILLRWSLNLSGVNINSHVKKFCWLLFGPCARYRQLQFLVVPYTSFPMISFWFLFFRIVYMYWKFPLTGFVSFLFGDFVR